jgi:hypothetical protein
MRNTGARSERSLAPLWDDDINEIRSLLGPRRHRLARSDHDGSWSCCNGCDHVAYWTAVALAARARKRGWAREEALEHVRTKPLSLDTLAKDGERIRRASEGVASRPDVAARAKVFTKVLDRAWAAGQLSQEPAVAVEVLRWAITYSGDPGEQVHDGGFLPFDRIARTVVGGVCTGGISDAEVVAGWEGRGMADSIHLSPAERVKRLWHEIERACGTDAGAAARLDELVSGCSARLGQSTDDGVLPLAGRSEGASTEDRGDRERPVVAGAVARLRADRRVSARSSGTRRFRCTVDAVVAELMDLYGVDAVGLAERPEVAELAHEVLAEVSAASA